VDGFTSNRDQNDPQFILHILHISSANKRHFCDDCLSRQKWTAFLQPLTNAVQEMPLLKYHQESPVKGIVFTMKYVQNCWKLLSGWSSKKLFTVWVKGAFTALFSRQSVE